MSDIAEKFKLFRASMSAMRSAPIWEKAYQAEKTVEAIDVVLGLLIDEINELKNGQGKKS